jgi:hypothetical protein
MTIKTLIQRKFRRRWSDLQLLVILELGIGPVAFARLVEETGGSTSGVWNCLTLLRGEALVDSNHCGGRTVYFLTETGKLALAEVLI